MAFDTQQICARHAEPRIRVDCPMDIKPVYRHMWREGSELQITKVKTEDQELLEAWTRPDAESFEFLDDCQSTEHRMQTEWRAEARVNRPDHDESGS